MSTDPIKERLSVESLTLKLFLSTAHKQTRTRQHSFFFYRNPFKYDESIVLQKHSIIKINIVQRIICSVSLKFFKRFRFAMRKHISSTFLRQCLSSLVLLCTLCYGLRRLLNDSGVVWSAVLT